MTTVNQYRVWCTNSPAHYEYTWGTVPPTVAPSDGSPINAALTTIVDTVNSKDVVVQEMSTGDFETTHITMSISSGTPGDVTTYDVTWPMDILLWKTDLTPNTAMIGDTITVMAAPETTVGALTAPASAGATVLSVSSTVFSYLIRGYAVTLNDGVHKNFLGRCIARDTVNSTITVETALTNSFAAGTPVQMSIYVLKDIYIGDTSVISIGLKGVRGKNVPAGTILRVYYTNNSGTAKTFRWRPEYYNNG